MKATGKWSNPVRRSFRWTRPADRVLDIFVDRYESLHDKRLSRSQAVRAALSVAARRLDAQLDERECS